MKFFKKLNLKKITFTLVFLTLMKVIGFTDFSLILYYIFMEPKSIIEAYASSENDPVLEQIVLFIAQIVFTWALLPLAVDIHLTFTDLAAHKIANELVQVGLVTEETTLEELIQLISEAQQKKIEGYSYPWNDIYKWELEHSRVLDDALRMGSEAYEKAKNGK